MRKSGCATENQGLDGDQKRAAKENEMLHSPAERAAPGLGCESLAGSPPERSSPEHRRDVQGRVET
jgi:hypothetical protein